MDLSAAQRLIEESFGVNDTIGRIVVVQGSTAKIGLVRKEHEETPERTTVGDFIGIRSAGALVVGVTTEVSVETLPIAREQGANATASVDMVGEIKTGPNGDLHFQRGVTTYPAIGDKASMVTEGELRLVFGHGGSDVVDIGKLHQDVGLHALINVDGMLQKHFAILGTTGVGKSSGVAVVLDEVMQRRPDLRVFLIDPHNEYRRCFGDRSTTLTPANLKLPFWLFNFEEVVDIFYRGRPGVDEEVAILAEVISHAKKIYSAGADRAGRYASASSDPGYTVDTPVPYRLSDLIGLIDDRMGKLENLSSRTTHGKLLHRIAGVVNDPRYAFMFDGANVGGDTMAMTIGQLFSLPIENQPMTIMQLAGLPAETVDSVVSVVARMAFDFGLWSDGALPLLFVCEEAHRYASANHSKGFGPTRRAISRIAKEGRKYGVFLGLVSQRPAELDQTILSQCSTLLAMRMANERDQAIIRSAVSDAAASLLSFLPSLGTREVLAFGEGVPLPTRLTFKELPPDRLPRSDATSDATSNFGRTVDAAFIDVVIDRWRGATLNNRVRMNEDGEDPKKGSSRPLDPDRYRILKKPGSGGQASRTG